jgi:hypothetical protein
MATIRQAYDISSDIPLTPLENREGERIIENLLLQLVRNELKGYCSGPQSITRYVRLRNAGQYHQVGPTRMNHVAVGNFLSIQTRYSG